MTRIFRNILLFVIQAVILVNLVVLVALNIPFVQRQAGSLASGFLSDLLHTEVSIGRIDMGLLNQLIITDIEIKDQQKQPLLNVQKLTGKVDLFLLGKNQIAFNTIQLLHFRAQANQPKEDAPTNFQFIIDALSSDKPSEAQTNVRINSLIIRDGDISFDKTYLPQKEALDVNHLHIQDLNAHISLKSIIKDSIRVRLRQLSLKEKSGLNLHNVSMTVAASQRQALITQFAVQLPHTTLAADTLTATYDLNAKDVLSSLQSSGKFELAPLQLNDLAFISPKLKDFRDRIKAEVTVQQEGRSIQLENLNISTEKQDLVLRAHAQISLPADSTGQLDVLTKIQQFAVLPSAVNSIFSNLQLGEVPAVLSHIGTIRFQGEGIVNGGDIGAHGVWETAVGQINTDINLSKGGALKGKVRTASLDLGQLLADNQWGTLACDVIVDGTLSGGKPKGKVQGDISSLVYKNYSIQHIYLDGNLSADNAEGSLSIDDPNIQVTLDGSASLNQNIYDLEANLAHLRPSVLGIRPQQDRSYSGSLTAQFRGSNIDDMIGSIAINNLSVQDTVSVYQMKQLKLNAADEDGQRRVSLFSDFMTAEIRGNYTYSTLPKSFIHVLERYIPSLVNYQNQNANLKNHFTFNIRLTDANPLKQMLDVPLELVEPVTLVGFFNDPEDKLDIDMIAGSFYYDGSRYEQARIRCQNNENAFLADVQANKFNKKSIVSLNVHAQAHEDQVNASISWDNNKPVGSFRGQLNADAQFAKLPGMPMEVGINIRPSDVTLNDTVWNIRPARVGIKDKEYSVSNLTIENGDRHLRVNGRVSENPDDSIRVELKDINVEYVLDAVNFDAVKFGGYASGTAYASNLLHEMKADTHLFVRNFHFQDGLMGNMNVYGRWENEAKAISLNAHIAEYENMSAATDSTQVWQTWRGQGDYVGRTHVKGQISPAHNTINLDIDAQNTNVAFLQGFVGTVFDNINGRATGWCKIGNTLKNVDITAGIKAYLNARVRALNTTYNIQVDSVNFVTNHMMFRQATITDRDGRQGMAEGDVTHYYLHKLRYDFRVKTDNLLCYETHDFDDGMPFYATAYAGGDININGGGGVLHINADVRANAGSQIVYDASIPEEVSNTQFITFVDKTPRLEEIPVLKEPTYLEQEEEEEEEEDTDIYIDMNVDMSPDASIRVLMDRLSGDFISAQGTGNLKASYYNKGAFKMFGLYNISKGLYRMSMQEVIRKDFNLQSGGVVHFNGDPFQAQLEVKAAYTVNSASLRDLSPTATFTQKTSTRVNCIMNIEGSLMKPAVTFDLELPSVSEEDKSMVKSLVATEEQMNMQIIYLLGVGRFYGGEYAQNSGNQTNQAMNSILTSTLSGQFNQMLSQVINSNSWNLGANINPGQNGMNDMEFQTMLQGSLFNNRLLINGNFGYKENVMMNSNFVGDFDVQWLLNNAGTLSLKAYNETNDRYFTRNTLNTQGLGIQFRREFERWSDLFRFSRRRKGEAK